jgi:integrase
LKKLYNSFHTDVDEDDPDAVVFSPKTVKNIHGVLHMALKQAVRNNLIRVNPCDACILPKITKKVIQPMDEDVIARFIDALEGHRFRALYLTTIFTGMRLGEVCGLQWECVDLTKRTILIDKQLQWCRDGSSSFRLATTKNGKSRTIALPASIVSLLKDVNWRTAYCMEVATQTVDLCLPMSWVNMCARRWCTGTLRSLSHKSAPPLPAFTICVIPMPLLPSNPATISRPFRRI